MQAWNWLGKEFVEFGVRWVVFLAIGVGVTLIFKSKMRKDLDLVMDHLGIDQKTRKAIKPRKVLSWLRPTAKPPVTKTWIDRQSAIALIMESSIVLEKSPRRKEKAKTILEQVRKNLAPFDQIAVPSGESAYMDKYEKEVSTGLLDAVILKHPHAKQGDKYSREIIIFELCQMALQSALASNGN